MEFNTQMRDKLAIAAARAVDSKKTKAKRSIILRIADNYDKGVGKKRAKDWDAHLKYHTHQKLVDQGIM